MNIVAKSQINVLVQLACLDKNFADGERDLIFRVGHGHNLTDDEIGTLIENPQPVGTLGALSPRQKLNYLLDCIEMIHLDDRIKESEMLFCRSLAIKMGLRTSVIDFLIENRKIYAKEKLQEKVFSQYIA